jgi:ribosomal subunit interface protein
MEIDVHGRHVQLTNDVRSLAEEKVEHLGRYLHGVDRAEVLFSGDRKGHLGAPVTCEVTIEGKGRVVRAAAAGPKPDAALEAAVDKAAHRLTKLKTRLVGRSRPRHKVPKPQLGPVVDDDGAADVPEAL